jgi:hypothetical protein
MSGDPPLPPPPPGSVPGAERPVDSPSSAAGTTPPPPPPGLNAPGGYVGFESAEGHRARLATIRRHARWAIVLTVIAGVGSLVNGLLSASLASDAQDYLDGRITEDEFLDANAIAPVGQLVSAGPMIAAAVFSMIWMYKMSKNVRTLGRSTTFAPVFAVVGWFLPPFLFVVPLLVLRELWKASDPTVPVGAPGWRASGEVPVLYVWFVLYGIVPAIITFASLGSVIDATLDLDTDTQSIAEVTASTNGTLLILGGVVGLAAAGAWAVLVRQLTDRHVALTGER